MAVLTAPDIKSMSPMVCLKWRRIQYASAVCIPLKKIHLKIVKVKKVTITDTKAIRWAIFKKGTPNNVEDVPIAIVNAFFY